MRRLGAPQPRPVRRLDADVLAGQVGQRLLGLQRQHRDVGPAPLYPGHGADPPRGDSAASSLAASIMMPAAWLNAISQACLAVSFQLGAANRCSVAISARLTTS